jgi:hypothetical protein
MGIREGNVYGTPMWIINEFEMQLYRIIKSETTEEEKSHSHFQNFFIPVVKSQCSKSLFPSTDKGKSQFPFYPFMTLFTVIIRSELSLSLV